MHQMILSGERDGCILGCSIVLHFYIVVCALLFVVLMALWLFFPIVSLNEH